MLVSGSEVTFKIFNLAAFVIEALIFNAFLILSAAVFNILYVSLSCDSARLSFGY